MVKLALAKLDMVGSRLVSNGLIFSDSFLVNIQLITFLLLFSFRSVSFFSANTCFVLLDITFLHKFFRLLSKFVFFTKVAISALVAEFACANLAAKFSAFNLLNSGVVTNSFYNHVQVFAFEFHQFLICSHFLKLSH